MRKPLSHIHLRRAPRTQQLQVLRVDIAEGSQANLAWQHMCVPRCYGRHVRHARAMFVLVAYADLELRLVVHRGQGSSATRALPCGHGIQVPWLEREQGQRMEVGDLLIHVVSGSRWSASTLTCSDTQADAPDAGSCCFGSCFCPPPN